MTDYERLTRYMQVGNKVVQVIPQRKERIQAYIDRLFDLEDKIESGELISKKEVERLQNENAALRERLDKAVELPCKVGDDVFCIVGIDPAVEEFEVEEILIKRTDPIFAFFRLRGIDIGVKTSCVLSQFGKRWFTELEAAEDRLAELKGEKE